jgi:hypothetical protein
MNNATNSQKTSSKILAIRTAARAELATRYNLKPETALVANTCPTCTRSHDAPFRGPSDERGRVTFGCVDAIHSGHLYGESLRFHERPEAQAIRRSELAKLQNLGRKAA